ncbi:MAG: ABC transporter permease subunit [Actinomycetes bacterium]
MSPLTVISAKTPFWRDIRILKWAFQFSVLAVVLAILFWLYGNYQENVSKSRIPTGLDFLDNPASFTIPGSNFDQSSQVRAAFVQGFINTLRVSVIGIVLAVSLGTIIGMARLSKNLLVRSVASAYVEIFRNLPLLVLLTFMNLAVVLQTFPRIEQAWVPFDLFVISNRGIVVPWFEGSNRNLLFVFSAAAVLSVLVSRVRKSYSDRTGKPSRSFLFAFLTFLIVILGAWSVLGYSWTQPVVEGRGTFGGLRLDPSFFALAVTLVIYTSSHIAEIVRGSILSVSKGQSEAADAIALSNQKKMRLIILPQAFRVALPAIGNQSLNLIKNSSLGAAISYFELTQIAQISVGNGSPAVPAFSVTLAIYLVISFVTSFIINIFNRRLELVER